MYVPAWYKGLCQTSFPQLGGHRQADLLVCCQGHPTSHTVDYFKHISRQKTFEWPLEMKKKIWLVVPLPVSRWQDAGWGWKRAGRPALSPPRRGARCRAALSRHWAESHCTADTNTRRSRAGWTGSHTARLKWLNRNLESIHASLWPHPSSVELCQCCVCWVHLNLGI